MPLTVMLSLESNVEALAAAAFACEMVSLMSFGA
jgi:hypothetical protein